MKPIQISDGPPSPLQTSRLHPTVAIIPHPLPLSRYGNPSHYCVNGHQYQVLKHRKGFKKRGIASWYGRKFQGQRTSSGEPYNMFAMTAAMRTLPIPCFVQVTNLNNGKHIIVKVNDRGPFKANRLIDLSYAAAQKLAMLHNGTAPVEVKVLDPHAKPSHDQHFIQVAAFHNYQTAQQLKQSLQNKFSQPIYVVQTPHSLYHVQIGPLKQILQPKKLLQHLKQLDYGGSFMVSR
jgi:rare lipoprotein A